MAITGDVALSVEEERICPISGQPMVNPVTTTMGTTYDREALLHYWSENGPYDYVLSKLAAEGGDGSLVQITDMTLVSAEADQTDLDLAANVLSSKEVEPEDEDEEDDEGGRMLALDAAEDEDEGEELVGWRLLEEVPLTDVCHACAAPTVCIACDKCGLVAYCSAACRLLAVPIAWRYEMPTSIRRMR